MGHTREVICPCPAPSPSLFFHIVLVSKNLQRCCREVGSCQSPSTPRLPTCLLPSPSREASIRINKSELVWRAMISRCGAVQCVPCRWVD